MPNLTALYIKLLSPCSVTSTIFFISLWSVNSGELDPPVPGDVDPTLVVIEEQYYKERFDSNQIYLS